MTKTLIPGALQRELEDRGLSPADLAGRVRSQHPGSRITRQTVWEAAAGVVAGVSYDTALGLLCGLDVRPSALFVMPDVAPPERR